MINFIFLEEIGGVVPNFHIWAFVPQNVKTVISCVYYKNGKWLRTFWKHIDKDAPDIKKIQNFQKFEGNCNLCLGFGSKTCFWSNLIILTLKYPLKAHLKLIDASDNIKQSKLSKFGALG